ncbi:MAG: right-handed parallel beta-helix repeat-containing protein [Phycisphaerales bacterium]
MFNRSSGFSVAASTVAFSALAFAGPLTPPPGPVAPTPGPEPRIAINATNTPGDNDATPSTFKITQPGSYYFASSLTGAVGKAGIEIAASNVTIDLNGFTLESANGSLSGIVSHTAVKGIVIRNGMLTNWIDRAINLTGQSPETAAASVAISDLTITGASEVAIQVASFVRIESVIVDGASSGIFANQHCAIRNCTVQAATSAIGVDAYSTIEGCTVRAGDDGLYLGGRGTVARNCNVAQASIGINVASGAGNDGIVVEGCSVASFSNVGIASTAGSTARIEGNSVTGDPNKNPAAGIWAGDMNQVHNNVVRNVRASGGASSGILISGSAGRTSVRGNNVVNCDKGIRSSNGGNAIFANTLSLNTKQFELAANNRVGPISTGTLSPQIDGNSGGNGMGSTDPNANILY